MGPNRRSVKKQSLLCPELPSLSLGGEEIGKLDEAKDYIGEECSGGGRGVLETDGCGGMENKER